MKDGSDAIADWAILNALLNVASGASWVSFHHGGGVGIGNSLHAGQVIVADGHRRCATASSACSPTIPGIGVARHADAGYDTAIATAAARGHIDLPMRGAARCSPVAFRPWHVPIFLAQVRLAARAPTTGAGALRSHACAATRAAASATTGRRRPSAKARELKSFADAARFFNPMMVTFTGGEPTLRRDLEDIVAAVRRGRAAARTSTLITHGGMLTPSARSRSGTPASTSSTSRSTTSTSGTTRRAAFPD